MNQSRSTWGNWALYLGSKGMSVILVSVCGLDARCRRKAKGRTVCCEHPGPAKKSRRRGKKKERQPQHWGSRLGNAVPGGLEWRSGLLVLSEEEEGEYGCSWAERGNRCERPGNIRFDQIQPVTDFSMVILRMVLGVEHFAVCLAPVDMEQLGPACIVRNLMTSGDGRALPL